MREIAAMTTVKSVGPGEYLFRESGPVRGFYVVLRGCLKLHRVFLSGHEQIIHIYRPGETLAEESLTCPAGHIADASAIEDSVVLVVRRQEFLQVLRRRPELTLRVLRSLDCQLQRMVRLLDDLTLKDVRTRVATWFLRQCDNPTGRLPERIELPLTKRLLASELGTTSETFSRTLASLRDERLVDLDRKAVILLCPSRLAASLERDGTPPRGPEGLVNDQRPARWIPMGPAADRARAAEGGSAPVKILPFRPGPGSDWEQGPGVTSVAVSAAQLAAAAQGALSPRV